MADTLKSTAPATIADSGSASAELVKTAPTGPLVSDQGRTSIADAVVSKIAGIATREVSGVHDLGGNTARAVGGGRGDP